ncbi:MAG: ATP-dependent DNA helicase RecG [Deltaproteobacteria bacterium]|nr:ATP-dependent DNA helicase RecG [Deltaproteobacteria bacterium]
MFSALLRPLEFAENSAPDQADRILNLDTQVASVSRSLSRLSIPPDMRALFESVATAFSSPSAGQVRLDRVREALALLESVRQSKVPDQVLARGPSVLSGVGPKREQQLAARGLRSIGDLLFHLPTRYEDRRRLSNIDELEVGHRATFIADVMLVDFISRPQARGSGQILQVVVGDEKGTLNLKWFRGGESIARHLKKGDRLLISGNIKRYRFSKEIMHPEIERLDAGGDGSSAVDESEAGQVVPIYTAPEGVNPRTLRRLIEMAVDDYADLVEGHLPQGFADERGLPSVCDALRALHRPPREAEVDHYAEWTSLAHERIVLEELYLLELGLALRREQESAQPGIALMARGNRVDQAMEELPFTLTEAQRRAWLQIEADLKRPHPMRRLLQGDVGSGKTVVAWLAAVASASSGFQAAIMAPTELLAEQHMRTLSSLARGGPVGRGIRLGLLTASMGNAEMGATREKLAQGELDVVVGTHALVQPSLVFSNLSLAIIDEQHRFGVRQRAELAQKGAGGRVPHSLVMTATPIPRTLALTVYGDLDVSVIDGLPPGRSPVTTGVLREGEGLQVTQTLRETLARGEQVYVVYPLVEESEHIDLRSALESTERIRAAFPEAEVGIVHGRLEAAERSDVMRRFAKGQIQILVATTVIEVGVDVANATLIIVEHAERFGLAQLHQLRGRVGRAERPGTCLLVARGGGEVAEARLRAMLETTDGFAIADADLRIRGPGEFLGTRQSGVLPDLRMADLIRDARLISVARETALGRVREDPGLKSDPRLSEAVQSRWGERLSLMGVG